MTIRVLFYLFVVCMWCALLTFVWPLLGPKVMDPCPVLNDWGAWLFAFWFTDIELITDHWKERR